MNEDVLDMIDTLNARLKDVQQVVESLPEAVPAYVQKLDKIDDQIYALQLELEKIARGEEVTEAKPAEGSKDGEKKEIISDEMKENLAEAGRAVGSVLRDSKDVVSEFSGTMKEIKDVFNFKK